MYRGNSGQESDFLHVTNPMLKIPVPNRSINSVGSVVPDCGTGSPSSCGVGVADGEADAVAGGVGGGGAGGVAFPNTCVPLLRIVKVFVMAMGLSRVSTEVAVTLCRPAPSDFVGV